MNEPRSAESAGKNGKRLWRRKPAAMLAKDALGSSDAFDDAVTKEWRFEAFFNFLRASPTYLAADKLSRPTYSGDAGSLPSDFGMVRQVFADLGSVHGRPFRYWWHDNGRYRFGLALPPEIDILSLLALQHEPSEAVLDRVTADVREYLKHLRQSSASPATMLLAVPLIPDRRAMLRALDEKLTEAYARLDRPGALAAYRPRRNRIQERTVHVAWTALCFRIAYPKEPLWRIALRVEAATAKEDKARKRAVKWLSLAGTPDDIDPDAYNSEASRFLDRAYRLAENAARGQFPSLDDVPSGAAPKGWWKALEGPLSREVDALRAGQPLPQWKCLPLAKDGEAPSPMPKARASHR